MCLSAPSGVEPFSNVAVDGSEKPLKADVSQTFWTSSLISAVAPSQFAEKEIYRLVDGMIERKAFSREPLEFVASNSVVWMPYYRIESEYKRARKDLVEKFGDSLLSKTALNAMLCTCAKGESELLMLFRPNFLKYELVNISPKLGEAVGSAFSIDLDRVFSDLVTKLSEVEEELSKLRSGLNKSYVRKRRYSMILPMAGNLKQEAAVSRKIAELSALRNVIHLCLNLDQDVRSVRILKQDVFYYPTSVFVLKHRENDRQRFVILNLVKAGSMLKRLNCDVGLAQLCKKNDECAKTVAETVADASSAI